MAAITNGDPTLVRITARATPDVSTAALEVIGVTTVPRPRC